MAYIGKTPVIGNFVKLDSITVVNGQAAYTMQNGGVNFTSYDNVNQFLVSLNGVLQAPTDSFTVSGSTLTFASNLSTGDVIDFVLVLGNSLDIGTPSDNTVTTAKLSGVLVTPSTLDVNGNELILDADGDTSITADTDDQIDFKTGGTDRASIDSSGNLNINTTTKLTDASISSGATGISLRGDADVTLISRDGGYGLVINRKTSDGDLVEFRKDGTTVGNIGTKFGDALYISDIATGLRFDSGGVDDIVPCSETGADRDDAINLGKSSVRFDDIYATNGTIQTSDQNEKQSIQSLTTAEMNVAKRLSTLIKTFKWNSAVEKKGDNARTHTGIIAQDVQQAFSDEELDASNYALFTSNTWWEKEISVEATEEKDAYTYMDIKEEATDGYTERSRLGIRYPELLSFIQAYNDQRFTELEARITALENA